MQELVNFLRRKVIARPRYQKYRQPPVWKTDADIQLIVVSHEATLTGAPKIILQLLKEFSKSRSIACSTILHNGGPLTTEFEKYSDVHCLDVKRKSTTYLQRMVNRVVARIPSNVPTIALVNSAESRFIAKALNRLSIPIVSLIHELPNSYANEDFGLIAEVSEKVIFPAKIVQDMALDFADFEVDQTQVVPQGLLDENFGTRLDAEDCRQQIRNELGIPRDARIVLGCGTLDLRKGFDMFANLAANFVRKHRDELNTHFVWLGDGIRSRHSPFHFVMIDVKKSGIEKNIHFVGERKRVEPFFTAADATLMVSREDPFPCVVHEAMASRTPVIAFEGAGGAPEAIADGAGIVVPYGDSEAVLRQLHRLLTVDDYHRQISEKAEDRVKTHYDFKQYFGTIKSVVEQVAGVEVRKSKVIRNAA